MDHKHATSTSHGPCEGATLTSNGLVPCRNIAPAGSEYCFDCTLRDAEEALSDARAEHKAARDAVTDARNELDRAEWWQRECAAELARAQAAIAALRAQQVAA